MVTPVHARNGSIRASLWRGQYAWDDVVATILKEAFDAGTQFAGKGRNNPERWKQSQISSLT